MSNKINKLAKFRKITFKISNKISIKIMINKFNLIKILIIYIKIIQKFNSKIIKIYKSKEF